MLLGPLWPGHEALHLHGSLPSPDGLLKDTCLCGGQKSGSLELMHALNRMFTRRSWRLAGGSSMAYLEADLLSEGRGTLFS